MITSFVLSDPPAVAAPAYSFSGFAHVAPQLMPGVHVSMVLKPNIATGAPYEVSGIISAVINGNRNVPLIALIPVHGGKTNNVRELWVLAHDCENNFTPQEPSTALTDEQQNAHIKLDFSNVGPKPESPTHQTNAHYVAIMHVPMRPRFSSVRGPY